jgi:glycosyltransferase involved in cell wall biosynthesis
MAHNTSQDSGSVLLSTILLNWNRADLLRKAVDSYLRTVTVDYELIVVDNASTDGSTKFIQSVCKDKRIRYPILLPQNLGGEALNIGLAQSRGRYLHITENDVEYLPGWDIEMLAKFEKFPELGQLSPSSPSGRTDVVPLTRDGATIYQVEGNVTTTSMIRRAIWDKGARWTSIESGYFKFPDDGRFSQVVKNHGYLVALNDKDTAINWGFHAEEIIGRLPYYIENVQAKPWLGIEGLRQRLRRQGYDLVEKQGGGYSTKRLPKRKHYRLSPKVGWKLCLEWLERKRRP